MSTRKLSDFHAEIEAHIALEAERLMQEGMRSEDAWHAARRRFGNVTATEERFYEHTSQPWLEHLAQDLRYAARLLMRNRTFATAAILTLALGIGANTAIFTAVDKLALHPVPYRDASRLMSIETREIQRPEVDAWTSQLDFGDLRDHNQSFTEMAAISPVWNMVMTGRGDAERLEPLFVSGNFFSLLGATPAAGRLFNKDDDRNGAPGVVVLSHGYWQRRFGGNRDVVGQSVTLDGAPYTVVGVLPADFHYVGEPVAGTSSDIEMWLPLAQNQLNGSRRFLRFLKVIGRLKPGVTPAQATQDMHRLGEGIRHLPDVEKGLEWTARPFDDSVAGRIRPMSFLLLGAVGLVLAMACVSVANLLLARGSARRREVFMRVALGASRGRLLAQLVVEGLLLAFLGGAAGFAVAYGGLRLLLAAAPASLLSGRIVTLDWRALLFTGGLVIFAAMLASLPPALKLLSPQIATALRAASGSVTGGPSRLRSVLAGLQVAFALMLLVGAGLLLRSFQQLLQVSPGFDAEHVVTVSTQMPTSARTPAMRAAIYKLMEQRVLAVPGVKSVDAVSRLPLSGQNIGTAVLIEGYTPAPNQSPGGEYRVATPGYFATMGIPLLAGRFLTESDNASASTLCIINEKMAHTYWPGQKALADVVGRRIKIGTNLDQQAWSTIVGIIGDVRHFGLEAAVRPEVYRTYALNPLSNPILVIRADSPSLPTLAAAVRSVDPQMPAYNVMPMSEMTRRSTAQRRFVLTLLSLFAVAAMLLAAVGVYGSASQMVAQRTREIGLRMALGATPGAALRMVMAAGARVSGAGVVAGALAAVLLSKWIRGLLYEVSPLDPLVFAAASVALLLIALAACFGPALRATRVAPMVALREE